MKPDQQQLQATGAGDFPRVAELSAALLGGFQKLLIGLGLVIALTTSVSADKPRSGGAFDNEEWDTFDPFSSEIETFAAPEQPEISREVPRSRTVPDSTEDFMEDPLELDREEIDLLRAYLPTEPDPLDTPEKVGPPARKKSSWQRRYELGPGDVLNFALRGRPNSRRLGVTVAPDGTISYLLARQIKAKGKTIDELRREVINQLGIYYKDPKLSITPAKLASKRYTIMGKVNKNGAFPLNRATTLLEAIALSSGIAVGGADNVKGELADMDRSYVVRNGSYLNVDFRKLYYEGDLSQNIQIEPNDYIYIASKLSNEVYVFGSVNSPGLQKMVGKSTLVGAIASAEGFDLKAWRNRVLIVRGSIHDPRTAPVDVKDIISGKAQDVTLEPGDIIYVADRPWAEVEDILDLAIKSFIRGAASAAFNF